MKAVVGGIYEFSQKTGLSFEDILRKRQAERDRENKGLYFIMLERSGYQRAQIAILGGVSAPTVARNINEVLIKLKRKHPRMVDLYAKIKDIRTMKCDDLRPKTDAGIAEGLN